MQMQSRSLKENAKFEKQRWQIWHANCPMIYARKRSQVIKEHTNGWVFYSTNKHYMTSLYDFCSRRNISWTSLHHAIIYHLLHYKDRKIFSQKKVNMKREIERKKNLILEVRRWKPLMDDHSKGRKGKKCKLSAPK